MLRWCAPCGPAMQMIEVLRGLGKCHDPPIEPRTTIGTSERSFSAFANTTRGNDNALSTNVLVWMPLTGCHAGPECRPKAATTSGKRTAPCGVRIIPSLVPAMPGKD